MSELNLFCLFSINLLLKYLMESTKSNVVITPEQTENIYYHDFILVHDK